MNEASLRFFSPSATRPAPAEPHRVRLPDGYATWVAAWERDSTVLWVTKRGFLSSYDFTTPAQVKATHVETVDITRVPEPLREALGPALKGGSNPSVRPAATPAP